MNLGGLQRKKDKRDFKLGAIQAPIPLPPTYHTDTTGVEPLFQWSLPTCASHAGASFVAFEEKKKFSPNFLWVEIKKIDGYPPEVGTDMRSIFKVLTSPGICEYRLLPENVGESLPNYTATPITQDMLDNADLHRQKSYAFTDNPTISQLKQAVYQNKQVLLLIWCDDGFFGTTTPTFTEKKYGHFVVCYGYSETGFLILDSTESDTTKSWKEIPYEKIDFIRELGTAVELDPETIAKLKQAQTSLIGLLQQYVTALKNIISNKKQ